MLISSGVESEFASNVYAQIFSLTPREALVAQFITQGCNNKMIAARMSISPHTVASYLRRIYGKVGVNNRVALVTMMVTAKMQVGRP
jgi:two-component system nitrate/nitrite response regulator NarL